MSSLIQPSAPLHLTCCVKRPANSMRHMLPSMYYYATCHPCITRYLPSMYHTLLAIHVSHTTCHPCITRYLPSMYHTLLAIHVSLRYLPSMYHMLLAIHVSHATCQPCITKMLSLSQTSRPHSACSPKHCQCDMQTQTGCPPPLQTTRP